MKLRIAILNDRVTHSRGIESWLTSVGHTTQQFKRHLHFQMAARAGGFDALIMNWGANDLSAISMLKKVRDELIEIRMSIPVVLITPHQSEEYVVRALYAGADDYIAGPVRRRELLARLESVTRRVRALPSTPALIEINELKIDIAARRIFLKNAPVELSIKEYNLAVFLLTNVGRLFARGRIKQAVWGKSIDLHSRTLDTHMSRVRRKLHLTEDRGWRLAALYRRGYRLERVITR
ncbi:MAG: response regulator transcription factor [Betaproteobacteria bacterium]